MLGIDELQNIPRFAYENNKCHTLNYLNPIYFNTVTQSREKLLLIIDTVGDKLLDMLSNIKRKVELYIGFTNAPNNTFNEHIYNIKYKPVQCSNMYLLFPVILFKYEDGTFEDTHHFLERIIEVIGKLIEYVNEVSEVNSNIISSNGNLDCKTFDFGMNRFYYIYMLLDAL